MVKDHSDNERKPAAATWAIPISSKGCFICIIPQTEHIPLSLLHSCGALAGMRNQ